MSNPNFEKDAAPKSSSKNPSGQSSQLNGNMSHKGEGVPAAVNPDILMNQEGVSEQEPRIKQKQSTASSQSPLGKDYSNETGKARQSSKPGKKAEKVKSGDDSAKKPKAQKRNPPQDLDESLLEEGKDFERSGKKGKKENRDHCNICKDGGSLLCCDYCPRSYHFHCLKLSEEDLPDGDWYCHKCEPIVKKRSTLEQERQKKQEEKQRKLEEKKELADRTKMLKEQELERKRDEKMKMKMQKDEEKRKLKEKSAQEVRNKLQQQTLTFKENKVELGEPINEPEKGPMEESKDPVVNGNEGIPKIEKSKNESAGAKKKKVEEKSEQEKAKDEKNQQIKSFFKLFASNYPELVEKNSIKYPIEDSLINKCPILHGAENFPEKPEPRKVLIDGLDFEKLLYIWEFGNNFGDYLDLAPFKLEELQCALILTKLDDLYGNEEDMTWEEQQTLRAINEEGFELINKLFIAFVATFMQEEPDKKSSENQSGQKEEADPFVQAINNHIKNYTQVWPELARLIIKMKSDADQLDDKITSLCELLAKTTPDSFTHQFKYDEKMEILAHLIDLIHEQDQFRNFLNTRIEEKSGYNKQKMEVQTEIKQLETQKMEVLKEYAQNDQVAENEQKLKQIEELENKLATASRIEARKIHEQINNLQAEKNKILKEKERIEDQISKKHVKIEKINEQAHKTSIKNQILGKDSGKSEYWFFKEDPGKVLIKKFHLPDAAMDIQMDVDEGEEIQIVMNQGKEPAYFWYYYDEEDQFNSLVDACNQKGIRERKLQDNLKRIAERMKLKKGKQKKSEEEKGADGEEEGKQEDNQQSQESQDQEEDKEEEQRHWVFENDNYYNAIQNAVWFGKKVPPKRSQGIMLRRNMANPVKPSVSEDRVSLEGVKESILSIEELYQELGLQLSREWAPKSQRDDLRKKIQESDSVKEITDYLLQLDHGFSDPTALKIREGKPESENEEDDKMDIEEGGQDEEKEDKMIKRSRIQFFKYWPSKTLRQSWRQYLFNDVQDGSINGLYICVKILEKVNEQYMQRQLDNQEKKNRKNGKSGKSTQAPQNQGRRQVGRMERKINYKEYFKSSSEDEDEDSSQEEEEKKRGPGRRKKVVESDEESESEDEEDDRCYICNKIRGEVMLCEGCPHVAHLGCTTLTRVPEGDWHCEDCLIAQSQRRTTRNQVQVQSQRQLRAGRR